MRLFAAGLRAAERLAEPAGTIVGALGAPVVWLGARARGDRLFHARGVVYDAEVAQALAEGPCAVIAERLAGRALVRFSNAWWRGRDWPDLLGVAVRFGLSSARGSARQDLVLATIRRPWAFPWAVATTRWDDFLANDYYAVTPYDADGVGAVEVRLRGGEAASATGVSTAVRADGPPRRDERLAADARAGRARLSLELRATSSNVWVPIATVTVGEPRPDARAVRFDPFRDGAGLRPRGFVHALRRAVYAASREAAPVPREDAVHES